VLAHQPVGRKAYTSRDTMQNSSQKKCIAGIRICSPQMWVIIQVVAHVLEAKTLNQVLMKLER
jgi:hypothetical protein